MHKQYALAIHELIKESDESKREGLINSFLEYLKRSGREKLLPGILRELKRIYQREKAPKILIAKESFKDKAEQKAQELGIENYSFEEDETLIGGYVIKSRGFLYDASYKRWLLDLYKSIKNI